MRAVIVKNTRSLCELLRTNPHVFRQPVELWLADFSGSVIDTGGYSTWRETRGPPDDRLLEMQEPWMQLLILLTWHPVAPIQHLVLHSSALFRLSRIADALQPLLDSEDHTEGQESTSDEQQLVRLRRQRNTLQSVARRIKVKNLYLRGCIMSLPNIDVTDSMQFKGCIHAFGPPIWPLLWTKRAGLKRVIFTTGSDCLFGDVLNLVMEICLVQRIRSIQGFQPHASFEISTVTASFKQCRDLQRLWEELPIVWTRSSALKVARLPGFVAIPSSWPCISRLEFTVRAKLEDRARFLEQSQRTYGLSTVSRSTSMRTSPTSPFHPDRNRIWCAREDEEEQPMEDPNQPCTCKIHPPAYTNAIDEHSMHTLADFFSDWASRHEDQETWDRCDSLRRYVVNDGLRKLLPAGSQGETLVRETQALCELFRRQSW